MGKIMPVPWNPLDRSLTIYVWSFFLSHCPLVVFLVSLSLGHFFCLLMMIDAMTMLDYDLKKKIVNEPEKKLWMSQKKNCKWARKKIVNEPEKKSPRALRNFVLQARLWPEQKLWMSQKKNCKWARKKISKSQKKLRFASSKHLGKHQEPVHNTFLKLKNI